MIENIWNKIYKEEFNYDQFNKLNHLISHTKLTDDFGVPYLRK